MKRLCTILQSLLLRVPSMVWTLLLNCLSMGLQLMRTIRWELTVAMRLPTRVLGVLSGTWVGL